MAITISGSGITSANIADGTIVNADINSSAAIAGTKLTGTGKVLQVVQVVKTDTWSSSTNSFQNITGMTASITPSLTSSKILVMIDLKMSTAGSGSIRLSRDGSVIYAGDSAGSRPVGFGQSLDVNNYWQTAVVGTFLDSPSSTSSVSYTPQGMVSSSGTVWANRTRDDRNTSLYDIRAASSITLMEIGA